MLNHDKIIFLWGWFTTWWYAKNLLVKDFAYGVITGQCMVGRVSYVGRVKQGNYHAHVLYTIPNPNYTLPKPYSFIITYPIHHPTLGTQTGRVLPCASINTTLPWIPTYPYPSIVIPYPSIYPTLQTVGKIPSLHWVSTPPTPSTHTCTHLTLPFITYPNLHFPTLYTASGIICRIVKKVCCCLIFAWH